MHPAVRSQTDSNQQYYSELSALTWPRDAKPITRQEFKDEADINKLFKRFGAALFTQPNSFSEVDWTIDLQQALTAIDEAKHAWRNLPENLRAKYTDWRQLLNALENGRLTIHPEEPTPPKPPESAPPA